MNTGSLVLDAPDRQLVAVAGVARVRRVALALLDRQLVRDLVAFRVIEADAEHLGIGELVHAVVQLAEDRLEVERRGDLAPDLAQELDVLLAFALGRRQGFGRLGAQLHFGEVGALPLLGDHAGALHAIQAEEEQSGTREIAEIRPPRAIPRRQDGEGVDGFVADSAADAARADAEAVVAESEVRVLALTLARPCRPVASKPSSRD